MLTFLTRRYRFQALHQLPEVIDGRPEFVLHGHDFALEVTVRGDLDAEAQWLVSRDKLDAIVRSEVLSRVDKAHLNHVFEHTSGESLAREIFVILEKSLPGRLHRVALQETRKNRFCTVLTAKARA